MLSVLNKITSKNGLSNMVEKAQSISSSNSQQQEQQQDSQNMVAPKKMKKIMVMKKVMVKRKRSEILQQQQQEQNKEQPQPESLKSFPPDLSPSIVQPTEQNYVMIEDDPLLNFAKSNFEDEWLSPLLSDKPKHNMGYQNMGNQTNVPVTQEQSMSVIHSKTQDIVDKTVMEPPIKKRKIDVMKALFGDAQQNSWRAIIPSIIFKLRTMMIANGSMEAVEELLSRFISSTTSKPITEFRGASGSGKTFIAKQIVEMANKLQNQYHCVYFDMYDILIEQDRSVFYEDLLHFLRNPNTILGKPKLVFIDGYDMLLKSVYEEGGQQDKVNKGQSFLSTCIKSWFKSAKEHFFVQNPHVTTMKPSTNINYQHHLIFITANDITKLLKDETISSRIHTIKICIRKAIILNHFKAEFKFPNSLCYDFINQCLNKEEKLCMMRYLKMVESLKLQRSKFKSEDQFQKKASKLLRQYKHLYDNEGYLFSDIRNIQNGDAFKRPNRIHLDEKMMELMMCNPPESYDLDTLASYYETFSFGDVMDKQMNSWKEGEMLQTKNLLLTFHIDKTNQHNREKKAMLEMDCLKSERKGIQFSHIPCIKRMPPKNEWNQNKDKQKTLLKKYEKEYEEQVMILKDEVVENKWDEYRWNQIVELDRS